MAVLVRFLAATLVCLAVAARASAETGVGPLPHPLVGASLPSMDHLGDDAFRFRALQWKRLNWVLELHRDARIARGDITFYDPTDRKVGWLTIGLSLEDYDRLMTKIDSALVEGQDKSINVAPGQIVVSVDGDLYSSERRANGRSTWVVGHPGFEDPNERVKDLLLEVFEQKMACGYRPVLGACVPP